MLKSMLEDEDAMATCCCSCGLLGGVAASICGTANVMCINCAGALLETSGICIANLVGGMTAVTEMGKQLIAELTTGK